MFSVVVLFESKEVLVNKVHAEVDFPSAALALALRLQCWH
jgi:hypothetical protein